MTRRAALKGAGLVGLTILSGCKNSPKKENRQAFRTGRNGAYESNAANNINGEKFGDQDFNVSVNIVNIAGKEYSFFPLENYTVSLGGQKIDKETLFPYAAVNRALMTEDIDPIEGTHTLMYDDGSATVFEKDVGIKRLTTEISAERKTLKGKNQIGNVGESRFSVPLLDFGRNSGLRRVAYGTDTDVKAEENIILVPDPRFRINHRLGKDNKGLVQILSRGGNNFYVENKADLKLIEPTKKSAVKTPDAIPNAAKKERENYVPVTVERVPISPTIQIQAGDGATTGQPIPKK